MAGEATALRLLVSLTHLLGESWRILSATIAVSSAWPRVPHMRAATCSRKRRLSRMTDSRLAIIVPKASGKERDSRHPDFTSGMFHGEVSCLPPRLRPWSTPR